MAEKAVVMARGLGTRMRDNAAGVEPGDWRELKARSVIKGLTAVAGRPFLDYVIGSLLGAGLRDIALVIAPECDLLRDYARRTSASTGAQIRAVVQREPLGTADAVLAAQAFVGAEPFLLCNCDNLYPHQALVDMASLAERSCAVAAFESDALVSRGNIASERVRQFAVLHATERGELARIVEKPSDPEEFRVNGRLWVNMNLYVFTQDIFDACRHVSPHPERGELELTDAVSMLIESAEVPFRVLFYESGVLDLTSRPDIASIQNALSVRAADSGYGFWRPFRQGAG